MAPMRTVSFILLAVAVASALRAPVRTCADTMCIAEYRCIDKPTGAVCLPTCLNNDCPSGTQCADLEEGGYECRPAATVTTCAETMCIAESRCFDTPTGAECRPTCLINDCPSGEQCVDLEEGGYECRSGVTTCADVMCYPEARCIEKPTGAVCMDTCLIGEGRCRKGTECVDLPEGGYKCQKPKPPTCAVTMCMPGLNCFDTPKGATCKCGRTLATAKVCKTTEACVNNRCVRKGASCSAIRCASGYHCEDQPQGGKCVKNATCKDLICIMTTRCVDFPDGARCVPL